METPRAMVVVAAVENIKTGDWVVVSLIEASIRPMRASDDINSYRGIAARDFKKGDKVLYSCLDNTDHVIINNRQG